MTFHGSHNYGSVLQAYATQKVIEKLGFDVEIINFRMESQKGYYSLYPKDYGALMFGQSLFMILLHKKRKIRFNKFEKFIGNMKLSGPELKNRNELQSVLDRYDILLSGSDQIWSNRIPELEKSADDFTGVYFFDFAKNNKPKIAYASSVGEITYDDLKLKKEYLDEFKFISTREQYGVNLLNNILKKDIELVLDPTFLLDKNEWGRLAGDVRRVKEPYIFLYTLRGLKNGLKWGRALAELSKRIGLKVVAIAPFFPIINSRVYNVVDAGPFDFLNLMKNAEVVFTDSFHGTAFSINMNKPFFSYVGKNTGDNRKIGIMRQFGLEERALESLEEIKSINGFSLDYNQYNASIDKARDKSREWLKMVLQNCR